MAADAQGLETIGAARFSDDGTKVGMTDTADPSSPWARTAVGDVARLADQGVDLSSAQAADINGRQAARQDPATQTPAQPQPAQDIGTPVPKAQRLS